MTNILEGLNLKENEIKKINEFASKPEIVTWPLGGGSETVKVNRFEIVEGQVNEMSDILDDTGYFDGQNASAKKSLLEMCRTSASYVTLFGSYVKSDKFYEEYEEVNDCISSYVRSSNDRMKKTFKEQMCKEWNNCIGIYTGIVATNKIAHKNLKVVSRKEMVDTTKKVLLYSGVKGLLEGYRYETELMAAAFNVLDCAMFGRKDFGPEVKKFLSNPKVSIEKYQKYRMADIISIYDLIIKDKISEARKRWVKLTSEVRHLISMTY